VGGSSRAGDPSAKETSDWVTQRTLDMSWTNDVIRVLEYFTERTPGSVIELKESCVAWHYRDCDVGHGNWQVCVWVRLMYMCMWVWCFVLMVTSLPSGKTMHGFFGGISKKDQVDRSLCR
jgi:hypothetical protein